MSVVKNFILNVVAVLLFIAFGIPGAVHDLIDAIRYGSFKRRLGQSFLSNAVGIDIACNVAYGNMLNAWFIKKGGYHYGKRDETVSSATGKNQVLGTLTTLGKGLVGILNVLQKDHCYLAIKEEEWRIIYKKPESIEWPFTLVAFIVFSTILYGLYRLLIFLF